MIKPSISTKYAQLVNEALEATGKTHAALRLLEQSFVISDNKMGYVPKHYIAQELVPRDVYVELKDDVWLHFPAQLLWTIDAIWEWYNNKNGSVKIIINNWCWNGRLQYRGYRPQEASWIESGKKVSASKYSMHTQWAAIDFNVYFKAGDSWIEVLADQARKDILEHQKEPTFEYITRLEKDVSWVHIDFANIQSKDIVVF